MTNFTKYNNSYELSKLSKSKKFNIFLNESSLLLIDFYITFLKSNLNINQNEILILADLTIYNKYYKIFFSKKELINNYNYYLNKFKKLFLYNYNTNIKYLRKFIVIKKRSFEELILFLNNKKRIYSYFEDINNTNINFYLPIIINLEYPN